MKKIFLFPFIVGSIMVLFAHCKPDDDITYPEIKAMLPVELSSYYVGDTIHFKVVASDNQKLKYVEVSLIDINNKPMMAPVTAEFPVNPFTWEGDYILSDSLLVDGEYYLQFKTSDGFNDARAFTKIHIHELSTEMLFPVISTHSDDGSWTIYRLQQNNTWKVVSSQSPDYAGIAVNSKKRILYTCGTTQTQLKAFGLPADNLLWQVEPHHISNMRWFEHIAFYDPYLYVACADGSMRCYDADGTCIYTSDAASNRVPSVFAVTNNLIISYMKGISNNDNRLISFHKTAGGIVNSKFIDYPAVDIQPLSNDKALVIYNEASESSIAVYNGTDDSFGKVHSYYEAQFTKLIKCNSDKFLITTTKGILIYTPSNNILVPYKMIDGQFAVAYNPYEDLIWIATGTHLYAYMGQSQTLVADVILPAVVTDIELMFTK